MKDIVLSLTQKYLLSVRDYYRHLHAHPELSFHEFETSDFVCKQLDKMQIPYQSGIAGTGILAVIEGKNPDKRCIALRADMDALPICEANDLAWKSENKNIMHACGHDAHTACLLGAASVLNDIRKQLEGRVLLVFQPGEEKAPGGARLMLEAGVFDQYKPDIVIGQHVSVDYPTGTLAFGAGAIMASANEIHVKIKGNGGHGALPHLSNDTVLAAAQCIVSLQQVKSRLCHPLQPMVLTFGRFMAEGAQNIIPHEVSFSGTFRSFDEKWRIEALGHIRRIIDDTASAYNCKAEIEIPDGYPSLQNDNIITEKAEHFAGELLGEEKIMKLETRMTSEDFAFFSQKYPSTFYRFGVKGKTNQQTGGLHSNTFRIDEEALVTGTAGLAWLAYRFLSY